jgi:hypothetical protein
MKKLALSLLLASGLFSSAALADLDYGLEVGVRSQSGDSDAANSSTTSQTAMQFGAFGIMPMVNNWNIRTGLLYTQRPLIEEVNNVENKISMNYIDIPVTIMYKFETYAGVYAGVNIGMNLDKSCDAPSCTVSSVKTLLPMVIGGAFKFAPNFGVNVYFETATGEVAKSNGNSLKDYRAVGANLLVTFD